MSEISQAARKKGMLKNTLIGVISKKYVLLRKQEKKEEIKENKFIKWKVTKYIANFFLAYC